MSKLLALSFIPLICLGVVILTGVVIIFALRRGTRSINEKLNDQQKTPDSATATNSRWARGDLESAPHGKAKEIKMKTCPACGGENKKNSGACVYCGTKI